MPLATLLVNGGTAIIGTLTLCMMAHGTLRYGFLALLSNAWGGL